MAFVGVVLWWIVLGALVGWVAAWWIGRSSQRLLTEPVIQIVERVIDNPRHVARIASLEAEVARIADLEVQAAKTPALQARVDELLAAPPRVVEKLVTRTVERVVEKPVERVVERVVPDTAAIESRDASLRAQKLRIEHLDALAAVLAERATQGTRPTPAPAPVAPAPALAPDTERTLRARIEHLEALAAVQADRLATSPSQHSDTMSPA